MSEAAPTEVVAAISANASGSRNGWPGVSQGKLRHLDSAALDPLLATDRPSPRRHARPATGARTCPVPPLGEHRAPALHDVIKGKGAALEVLVEGIASPSPVV